MYLDCVLEVLFKPEFEMTYCRMARLLRRVRVDGRSGWYDPAHLALRVQEGGNKGALEGQRVVDHMLAMPRSRSTSFTDIDLYGKWTLDRVYGG